MDDKHIEELLRTAWTPMAPVGMRERTLCPRATEPSSRRVIRPSWRSALVGAAIAVVLYCGVADHTRQIRLCTGGSTTDVRASAAVCSASSFGLRREMARLLAEGNTGLGERGDKIERSTL